MIRPRTAVRAARGGRGATLSRDLAVAGPAAIFERAQARGELPAGADVSMALTVIAGAMSHRIFVEHQSLDGDFLPRLVGLVVDGLVNGSGGRG